MNWPVFDTNKHFTAGEKGLEPAPPLGPHYAQQKTIFGVISLYTRAREITTKNGHLLRMLRRPF